MIVLASPTELDAARFFQWLMFANLQIWIMALLTLKSFFGDSQPENRAMTTSGARPGCAGAAARFLPGGHRRAFWIAARRWTTMRAIETGLLNRLIV